MPSTTWSAANGMIRHWDSSGRRDRFYGPSATLAPAATHKCCSSLTSARPRGAPREHDPEKWIPVFGKRSCSTNKLERDDDSKKSHLALGNACPPKPNNEPTRVLHCGRG